MEFPTTITAARIDVANERIDTLMCSLYHTQVLKKFSQEEQHERMLHYIWEIFVCLFFSHNYTKFL